MDSLKMLSICVLITFLALTSVHDVSPKHFRFNIFTYFLLHFAHFCKFWFLLKLFLSFISFYYLWWCIDEHYFCDQKFTAILQIFSQFMGENFHFKNRMSRFYSILEFFSTDSVDEEVPEKLYGKRKTWVVLVAGSNGWYNYRHQISSHQFLPLFRNIYFRNRYTHNFLFIWSVKNYNLKYRK